MLQFFSSLYLHKRFYYYLSLIVILFLTSFWFSALYLIVWLLLFILIFVFLYDIWLLYRQKNAFSGERQLAEKLSNSDENEIQIKLHNKYAFQVHIKCIDEIPVQFQKRDFLYESNIKAFERDAYTYKLRPVERGVYTFGKLIVYVSSPLKIVARRFNLSQSKEVKVYPSYIQMKKYEFLAMSNRLTEYGLKKIRRLGHSMEFEQIKEYITGDDVRTINWKATAKKGHLMVNQYQDEKSQPIYSIIDLGRAMKMPFEGLKLLDYAINATLAFSNIALRKNDKAGLVSFSKKIDQIMPASNKKTHLHLLNESLYSIDTAFTDSDFELLYAVVKRKITQRSLLILYTNFEHISAMKRQVSSLQALAKKHLLLVVFFKNTELDELIEEKAEDVASIYDKSIAQKFAFEKRLIVKELEKRGVHVILTKPQELSVQVINRYLEFKARGLI